MIIVDSKHAYYTFPFPNQVIHFIVSGPLNVTEDAAHGTKGNQALLVRLGYKINKKVIHYCTENESIVGGLVTECARGLGCVCGGG